jgi:hypothetical protein
MSLNYMVTISSNIKFQTEQIVLLLFSISLAYVHEPIIPTERLPPIGEVSANFCGYRVPRGQLDVSLRPYSHISRPELLLLSSPSWNQSEVMKHLLCSLLQPPIVSFYFGQNILLSTLFSNTVCVSPCM